MFSEIADTINSIKVKAMEAMLPKELPTKMRETFLERAKEMSPAQIEEVGRRFVEGREKAREEWMKRKEQKRT